MDGEAGFDISQRRRKCAASFNGFVARRL